MFYNLYSYFIRSRYKFMKREEVGLTSNFFIVVDSWVTEVYNNNRWQGAHL